MRRAALFVLLGASGCITTATLATTHGRLEATINGGDEESLAVTNEAGLKRRVRREDILEIDHPGNVLATIFGIGAVGFALELTGFAASGICGSPPRGTGIAPCIAIGSFAAASVGLFAWGLWTWLSSRSAVFNPPPAADGDMARLPFAFPGAEPGPAVVPPPPPLPPQPGL